MRLFTFVSLIYIIGVGKACSSSGSSSSPSLLHDSTLRPKKTESKFCSSVVAVSHGHGSAQSGQVDHAIFSDKKDATVARPWALPSLRATWVHRMLATFFVDGYLSHVAVGILHYLKHIRAKVNALKLIVTGMERLRSHLDGLKGSEQKDEKNEDSEETITKLNKALNSLVFSSSNAIAMGIALLYFALLFRSQTPGMMILNIIYVDEATHQPLSPLRMVGVHILSYFLSFAVSLPNESGVPTFLGLDWLLVPNTGRTLSERLIGAVAVKMPVRVSIDKNLNERDFTLIDSSKLTTDEISYMTQVFDDAIHAQVSKEDKVAWQGKKHAFFNGNKENPFSIAAILSGDNESSKLFMRLFLFCATIANLVWTWLYIPIAIFPFLFGQSLP